MCTHHNADVHDRPMVSDICCTHSNPALVHRLYLPSVPDAAEIGPSAIGVCSVGSRLSDGVKYIAIHLLSTSYSSDILTTHVNYTTGCMHAMPHQPDSLGHELCGPYDPAACTASSLGECPVAIIQSDGVLVQETHRLPVSPSDVPTCSLSVAYNKLYMTLATRATNNMWTWCIQTASLL